MATPLTRDELIAKLTEQRARLEAWFAARTPEELERPLTANEVEGGPMWAARDHLAHVVGAERYLMGVVKRTVAGGDDPAGVFTQSGSMEREPIMRVINEWNQAGYAKYHDAPVETLLAKLREQRPATLALLASLTDEQLDQASPHSPFLRGTVRDLFRQVAHHDGQHVDWLTQASGLA